MQANRNAISLTSENVNILLCLIQMYTLKEKITVQKAALQCTVLPGTIALTLCNLLLKKLISPFFLELVLKRPWKEQSFIYSNNNKKKCIAREERKIYLHCPCFLVLLLPAEETMLSSVPPNCMCMYRAGQGIKTDISKVCNLCSGPDIN